MVCSSLFKLLRFLSCLVPEIFSTKVAFCQPSWAGIHGYAMTSHAGSPDTFIFKSTREEISQAAAGCFQNKIDASCY